MRKRNKWQLSLESETSWFVLLNVCDAIATFALLRRNSHYFESNPIARWFYEGWGFRGMVWFKAAMVVFVVTIAQIVARQNEPLARLLLVFGCIAVGSVFVYSFWLGSAGAPPVIQAFQPD